MFTNTSHTNIQTVEQKKTKKYKNKKIICNIRVENIQVHKYSLEINANTFFCETVSLILQFYLI